MKYLLQILNKVFPLKITDGDGFCQSNLQMTKKNNINTMSHLKKKKLKYRNGFIFLVSFGLRIVNL